jgi:hypothetical protein
MDNASWKNFAALNEEAKRIRDIAQNLTCRITSLESEILNLRQENLQLKSLVITLIGGGPTSG